ncbi:hypothetical protein Tco_1295727, partial [Tanacetum coccineum]
TSHYWPKVREPAKPHHVIASSESRNSSKNMPRFSSNDMVHNHYLEKAKKKTHEKDRNSKTSVMPSARLPTTDNGSKPKPRSTNQMTRNWPTHKCSYVMKTDVPKAEHSRSSSSFSDSKRFVCSTCQKCVFNANHDACITNLLKEVNSRTKSTWKPMSRIFTSVGLRWIPMGKIVGTCLNTNDSAILLRKETCSHKSVICANSSSLSVGLQHPNRDPFLQKVTYGNPVSVINKQYCGLVDGETTPFQLGCIQGHMLILKAQRYIQGINQDLKKALNFKIHFRKL